MQTHPVLSEFIRHCQKQNVCYQVSTFGLEDLATRMKNSGPENRFRVVSSLTANVSPAVDLPLPEVRESCQRDGEFQDAIAKSMLVLIFAEWDERYRPQIAKALNVKTDDVTSDLMGDLRNVRKLIVHGKSNVKGTLIMDCLDWQIPSGQFVVTSAMMNTFFDQINRMTVEVKTNR